MTEPERTPPKAGERERRNMGLFAKKNLGIDIGASSIKIVEVSLAGEKKTLENYVEFKLPHHDSSPLKTFYGESLLLLSDEVADILQAVLKKAKIKERRAAFAIPDFSTFFTTFDLPPMTETEIPQAIEFEARHHIPLPLEEVTFDWQIIEKQQVSPGVKLKVLLVAVPNNVLNGYQRMATLCNFNVQGMEAEVFGFIRSSVTGGRYWGPVCLVDIGWQSTTVSIVDKKVLRVSHSFDLSGTGLTRTLSKALQVGIEEAEELKTKYGLDPSRPDIANVVSQELNALAVEVERVYQEFERTSGQKVEVIILTGGTTAMFGLREYFEGYFQKQVHQVNPFSSLTYPPILKERLTEMAPSFAVAVGVAMMGMEK